MASPNRAKHPGNCERMIIYMSSITKAFFRDIWKSKGRFVAICAIIAIGCGFFAGVKSTCPDMLFTAEKYFDAQNLMDFHLKSTYGFNEEDITALKETDYIKDISASYSSDFFLDLGSEADVVIKAYSYKSDENINKLVLKEGRYPTSENECLAEDNVLINSALSLGKKITLKAEEGSDISNTLKNSEYTVVGIVESPLYITYERGTSKIGNGKINSFIYLPYENFKYEYYTDIFMTVNKAGAVSPFSDKYDSLISDITSKLKEVANLQQKERYDEAINEASDKLNVSKEELQAETTKITATLADSLKKLNESKAKLESGKQEYTANIDKLNNELAAAQKQITSTENALAASQTEYNAANDQYNKSLKEYETALSTAQASFAEMNDIIADLEDVANGTITDTTELYDKISGSNLDAQYKGSLLPLLESGTAPTPSQINQINLITASMKENIAKAQAGLDATKKQLDETALMLADTKSKLDTGNAQLRSSKDLLASKRSDGEKALDDAYIQLTKAQEQIDAGQAEYLSGKAQADEKINNAKIEISNAEKAINELENPRWYIFDRKDNPGYDGFETDAKRVDKIAAVFPIFFILVAALVCLTTMTRMVEEQRTQIGTLKALGYSKHSIYAKYIGYAAFASAIGSAAGLSLGFKLFPIVIFKSYKILYTMPDIIAAFRLDYAVLCTAAAVLCTSISAFIACYKELLAVPAELMRPKAPKNGKRVLLERITPIWSRLSFIYKVTVRNIFRYKKRVLMTVIGIAGCTALMLTGFGLKYSISSIIDKQFGEIFHYDLMGVIDEDIDSSARELINTQLVNTSLLKSSINIFEKSVDINNGNKAKNIYIFAPETPEDLNEYITFRNRKSNDIIKLDNSSAIITEKIAKLLNIKAGDEITLSGINDTTVTVKISAITENYTNNYLYMTPEYYKSLFGNYPNYNSFISKMNKDTEQNRTEISSSLLKNSDILGISYVNDNAKRFHDILKSLNLIVLVLIFSAGALAFVVLYNLTNINITERKRELATIKVLGFFNIELSKYIYRENIISTLLGVILGLIIGVPFDRFVVSTAEVDAVMFTPSIDLMSFLYAIALTLVFAAIVNFILYGKLKKIDMVESLKSIE